MLWDRTKDYIQENYLEIHQNYKQLRATIAEAWDAISDNTIRGIIRTMPAWCHALIDAQGSETMH